MISSTANKQVKYVSALLKKAKTRKEEGLFVAEGLRMCREIPPGRLAVLYVSESFKEIPEYPALAKIAERTEVVADQVFPAMSDTQSPQGVLALVRQSPCIWERVLKNADDVPAHLVILERIQDPGNLGTIFRSAEGAGATGILMDMGTADIYSPKAVRSTMGSMLRIPFAYTDNLGKTLRQLKNRGIRLCAAHLSGEKDYDQETYTRSIAFLIGNEANGLTAETADLADIKVRIPMAGKVESLNASVAASLLMFEAARQRRGIF